MEVKPLGSTSTWERGKTSYILFLEYFLLINERMLVSALSCMHRTHLMPLDFKHIYESYDTRNNFSKSGNTGTQLGIVTKIPRAESVALVDTERSGLQISQYTTWLVPGQHHHHPPTQRWDRGLCCQQLMGRCLCQRRNSGSAVPIVCSK